MVDIYTTAVRISNLAEVFIKTYVKIFLHHSSLPWQVMGE
jgi:hypothetical protein